MSALVLAVLYFALMELLLIDSSRALTEAQRFRSRVVAETLAENAAELAALQMINTGGANVTASDFQGTMHGTLRRTGDHFELEGEASTIGVMPQAATVFVQGTISGTNIAIDYTNHTP
ncbi:MAG TPA: hypothetical protein VLV78_11845 [Thermoanaerobaculia bacterium]|nr:hypothetical protein [Thermoanaerobaculia bacterium]